MRQLRLGRVLQALAPDEPEVHALVALMEFQASRFAARADADGNADPAGGPGPHPLGPRPDPAQHRRHGARRTAPAGKRGGARTPCRPHSRECHAVAPTAADTDWSRIVALYDALLQIARSPVVELNRAVAVAMSEGPAAALRIVDAIDGLDGSHLLPSVRGELLARLGRDADAAAEFTAAAALTANERERERAAEKGRAHHVGPAR